MFDFITGLLANPKLVDNYSDILWNEFVQTETARSAISKSYEFAKQNNMSSNDIKHGRKNTITKIEQHLKTVQEISRQHAEELSNLINAIVEDPQMKTKLIELCLNKFLICMAESGTLYEYDKDKTPLPIVYKANEKLHFFSQAINVKRRKKTVSVNFGGPVASIRICKGVRYRLGSMNIDRKTVETYDSSDHGIFYITSQRIGYIGKTQFSFDLKKLVSIQNGEAGILLYKQGKEQPYMIYLDNYDAPCAIISCLLNQ
ncbi:MAG: hypothetical protein K6E80_01420 [Schwartzia sp.]|nr:hypothetical protein [Schwartzia sp. (in: firmicutes)]